MTKSDDTLASALFSELFMADQLARSRLAKVLPKGMELSHFSVLNYLAQSSQPRTPAQLARTFNLTKGAMTNTLSKLEWAGHINVSPDWDDARRKQITISHAGRNARDSALATITPIIGKIVDHVGQDEVRATVPVLRELRKLLSDQS